MSLETEQKKALQKQHKIKQVEDDLVTWIQNALDPKSFKIKKLEESQFRNLVSVADTTESTEVIKNFIRYQVGRGEKWGRGKESLAAKIIQDIDKNIKKTAENIGKELKEENYKPIWIELIRRYLGYGYRHLKYLKYLEDERLKSSKGSSQ